MVCLSLFLSAATDFAIGFEGLPDPHQDDFRLIVLGDSFAAPRMNRIPTALMARLPEGRIRAWRVPVTPNAFPFRLVDVGADAFQVNDPSEAGCYLFEADRGGARVGLPLTRPMDLRVANGPADRLIYDWRLEGLEPGRAVLSKFSQGPVSLKVIHRWPTSSFNTVPLTTTEGTWIPGDILPPGSFGELGTCELDQLSVDDRIKLRTAANGAGALQALGAILSSPSDGIYFSALSDESWSYLGYASDEPCDGAGDKKFDRAELAEWISVTTLDPSEPIVFLTMLSTEIVTGQEFDFTLDDLVQQSFSAVSQAGLDVPVSMVFVLPFRHSIGGVLPVDEEPIEFDATWEAMSQLADEREDVGAISLYHLTDGIRFDGGQAGRRWLEDRCLNLHSFGDDTYNLSLPPYLGMLHDAAMIHPRDEVAATFMARLLRFAWRGWSWPGDVDADGQLTTADRDLVLQMDGQTGFSPADLNEDGVVNLADLDEIERRLDCASDPPSPPNPDFNGDGSVNYEDLLILLANWEASDIDEYDLNADGMVDYVDLLILLSDWSI